MYSCALIAKRSLAYTALLLVAKIGLFVGSSSSSFFLLVEAEAGGCEPLELDGSPVAARPPESSLPSKGVIGVSDGGSAALVIVASPPFDSSRFCCAESPVVSILLNSNTDNELRRK